MKKCLLLFPCLLLFILSCIAGQLKLRNSAGNSTLKEMNKQVIGISKMLPDEQESLRDAFAHALSQISSLNGIAIAEVHFFQAQ